LYKHLNTFGCHLTFHSACNGKSHFIRQTILSISAPSPPTVDGRAALSVLTELLPDSGKHHDHNLSIMASPQFYPNTLAPAQINKKNLENILHELRVTVSRGTHLVQEGCPPSVEWDKAGLYIGVGGT
jgi:hypothetical protein